MKNLLTYTLLLSVTLFLTNCKKDRKKDTPTAANTTEQNISGKVILPEGSNIDIQSLSVVSPGSQITLFNTDYQINVQGAFSTVIVMNPNEDVILMGYFYPGQTDRDINSQSTAIALIANSPIVSSLTDDGKVNVINAILQDSKLAGLIAEIETLAKSGKSILSSENVAMVTKMSELLESVAPKSAKSTEVSVTYQRHGRNLHFANPGVAIRNVAGIYKNGTRVKKIVLEEKEMFATSLAGLLGQISDLISEPKTIEETYAMEGDGEFQVKIRTGQLSVSDGSIEYTEARKENLIVGAELLLKPLFESYVDGECIALLIRKSIDVYDISSSNNATELVAGLTQLVLSSAHDMVECTSGKINDVTAFNKFLKAVDKYLNLFQIASVPMVYANSSIFLQQWSNLESKLDFCYTVGGNNISNCDDTLYIKDINLIWINSPLNSCLVMPGQTFGSKFAIQFNINNSQHPLFLLHSKVHFQIENGNSYLTGSSLFGNTGYTDFIGSLNYPLVGVLSFCHAFGNETDVKANVWLEFNDGSVSNVLSVVSAKPQGAN